MAKVWSTLKSKFLRIVKRTFGRETTLFDVFFFVSILLFFVAWLWWLAPSTSYKPLNIVSAVFLGFCIIYLLFKKSINVLLGRATLGEWVQLVALIVAFCWAVLIILPQEMPHFTQNTIECPATIDYSLDDTNQRLFDLTFIEFTNAGSLPAAVWLEYDINNDRATCWTALEGTYTMGRYRESNKKCQSISQIGRFVVESKNTFTPHFKFGVPSDINIFEFTIFSKYYLANLPTQLRHIYWFFLNGEVAAIECTCKFNNANFICRTQHKRTDF